MAEITKKILKKLYYKQKLSAVKIARKLNVSSTTIYNYMKKYNLKRNGNKNSRIVKCANCGKNKKIKLSQYKQNKNKRFFCDFKCLGEWRSKNLNGEKSHHWVSVKNKTVKCDFCGKDIIKMPANIKKYSYHFCNNKCKNKWLKENAISGEEHYNWKNGKSFEPYPSKFTKSLKRKVKKRDNHTCQICKAKEKSTVFHVHHIDYNKDNCSMDNLITLCNSCHSKTNFNRKYWEKFFKNKNKAN